MPRDPLSPEFRPPLSDTITMPSDAAGPTPRDVAEEAAKIYPDTNPGPPTPEEIAVEAYKIYQARGSSHGSDLDDWLEAERRLRGGPQS